MVLRSISFVSTSALGGSSGRSLYGKFLLNMLISSRVSFTLASDTRVKILVIYSRWVNESKKYTRFLKSEVWILHIQIRTTHRLPSSTSKVCHECTNNHESIRVFVAGKFFICFKRPFLQLGFAMWDYRYYPVLQKFATDARMATNLSV